MHSKNNNNGAYLFLVLFPCSASSFSTLSHTHTHTFSLFLSMNHIVSLPLIFSLAHYLSLPLWHLSLLICPHLSHWLSPSLNSFTHSHSLFLSLLSQSISFLVLKLFCKREKLDKAKFKFRKTLPEKSSIKSKSSFQILSRKPTFVFSNSKSTTSKLLIFGFTTSGYSL